MAENIFKNDSILGNSKIGFEIRGKFRYDDDVLIEKLKGILNRNVIFSNVDYKLLDATDDNAVLIKDGNYYVIKTALYNYFEAMYIMPNLLEFMKSLKDVNGSYLYFKIGFNENFIALTNVNIMKFILMFNENSILKGLSDITKNGSVIKMTDIRPNDLNTCLDPVQKQVNSIKFGDEGEDMFGIAFSDIKLGYVTFKYAKEINYGTKWDEIVKGVMHTIITLYNATEYSDFTEDENTKIRKMNDDFATFEKTFRCYEVFHEKYKSIKFTLDLDNDKSKIDVIFPSIKEKLFNIVVVNGITDAEINYDSDISRLQLKNLELKNCYKLSGVDIVESEISSCKVRDCDIYDTKIENSTIIRCNLFGYANNKECSFDNCFISRNIQLKDCKVSGTLGKMGGSMKGGSLRDTTIIASMAEIADDVEKNNVNEVQ